MFTHLGNRYDTKQFEYFSIVRKWCWCQKPLDWYWRSSRYDLVRLRVRVRKLYFKPIQKQIKNISSYLKISAGHRPEPWAMYNKYNMVKRKNIIQNKYSFQWKVCQLYKRILFLHDKSVQLSDVSYNNWCQIRPIYRSQNKMTKWTYIHTYIHKENIDMYIFISTWIFTFAHTYSCISTFIYV